MKKKQIVPEKGVDVFKLLKVLNNLKPFFEDSGHYTGIYEKDIVKLCNILQWKRKIYYNGKESKNNEK